ncbi:glycoside hydrolase family 2 TIM barrel-domain containing protein [Roseimarinus sediminis]|uniref:glycoside hydrolase family 2 TIM barrel-domain containing protein n=1 Tax=Roseimarinus sediminis TaxID=1610899 RepID=UPI003D1BC2C7
MRKFKSTHLIILLGFLFFLQGTALLANEKETQIVYLSGTGSDDAVEWDFFCTAGRNSGHWTKIEVPSCWEQQGFGNYNYGVNFYGKATHPLIPTEQGMYKHRFNVPDEWRGKSIHLVFEGSMTDTRVVINGKSAGEVHQGGFYRFQYDITNYLKYGAENLLEVTVKKESDDESVNLAERRADYWNFGGIFRPVFLEVMPATYIDHTAIDAKANGAFLAEVHLGVAPTEPLTVSAQLTDAAGKKIGNAFSASTRAASDKIVLRNHFEGMKTWTPETPELYFVQFKLEKNGEILHEVTERIGFRTIEIKEGDGIYINGARVNMRGVNRHSFRPETGRTLSKAANYEDVRLIKEMNMNTVRLSHYPADPEFLAACDELGLYVMNEVAGWHGRYNTAVGRKLVRETVQRDVNHPSVVFWANGNEGGWNVELDDDYHLYDPQKRPVVHPQQDMSGLETMHYRSYGQTQEYLRGEMIFFPTEFLHGLYDGGHGAGLYDYWNMMYDHPRCAGGLLWVLADEGVIRTDLGGKIDCDGNHGADGIVGPHHEKEGSFFTIKEIWSPVYIDMETLPANFDGNIPVENRYDFTNLNECTFQWKLLRFGQADEVETREVVGEGTAKSPDIAPHAKGFVKVPASFSGADALHLTALGPDGKELFTWSWNLAPQQGVIAERTSEGEAFVEFAGYYLKAQAGDLELRFDRDNGLLTSVIKGGKTISFGNGPRFVAQRRADRSPDGWVVEYETKGIDRLYEDISDQSKLTNIEYRNENGLAIIETEFFGPLKKVTWILNGDGQVQLDYTYEYDGVVELMGIQFDYPEEKMQAIRWLGEGPYRVWQNRVHGTVLDVWENDYNDPIPGETFEYPEFKGFFGNWRWASFKTDEGNIRIATSSFNNYLGVYTPRDGRDTPLYTFPETGIAVLDVIPALRNKVNATDLLGPSSKAHDVNGEQSGTIWLNFE